MSRLSVIRTYAPQIRQRVSPEQALSRYVPGYRNYNGYALCIAHQEKTASMKVGQYIAHCFGCGFHGDSVEIVKHLFRCDTFRAMTLLNDDFGLNLPVGKQLTLRESMELREQTDRIARERTALHEAKMAKLERILELQWYLFDFEDMAMENRPTDPDAPYPALYVHAIKNVERFKYLIDCEG